MEAPSKLEMASSWRDRLGDPASSDAARYVAELDAQGALERLVREAESAASAGWCAGLPNQAALFISNNFAFQRGANRAPQRSAPRMPSPAGDEPRSLLASLYATLTHPAHRDTIDDGLAVRGLECVHRHHALELLQPIVVAASRRGRPQQEQQLPPYLAAVPAVLALGRPAWLAALLERHGLKPDAA
jgi:hypothetical protein